MMIISTLFLAGCNKDDDRYYSEEAVALAKVVEGRYSGQWTGTIDGPKGTWGTWAHPGDTRVCNPLTQFDHGDIGIELWLENKETNLFKIEIGYTDIAEVTIDAPSSGGGKDNVYFKYFGRPIALDKNGKIHFDNILETNLYVGLGTYGSLSNYGFDNPQLKNITLQYNKSTGTISGSLEFVTTNDQGKKLKGMLKFENLMRD